MTEKKKCVDLENKSDPALLLLTNCGTLGKPLNLSEPQFSYLWNEDDNAYLIGLL